MKKLLTITFTAAFITGCVTQPNNNNKNSKFTEEDCKKMLGEETYNRLNILYNDPTAAMLQCQFKLENRYQ